MRLPRAIGARLTAAALLAAPLHALPAAAAGGITLSGATSASVDVVATQDATASVPHASTLDATIGGTYAGFAIQRLPDLTVLLGAVRAPALEAAGYSPPRIEPQYAPMPFPFTSRRYAEVATLQAGSTYRFTLLADGPATLRIPTDGLTLDLSPARAVVASGGVISLGPAPETMSVPLGEGARAIAVGPNTHVVVAAAVAHVAGQASLAVACVAEPSGAAPCGAGTAFATPLSLHTRYIDDRAYMPSTITATTPTAHFRTVSAGVSTVRRGFWLAWETR